MFRAIPLSLMLLTGCFYGGGKYDTSSSGIDECPEELQNSTWQLTGVLQTIYFDYPESNMKCALTDLDIAIAFVGIDESGHAVGVWAASGTVTATLDNNVVGIYSYSERLIQNGLGTAVGTMDHSGDVTIEFYSTARRGGFVNATAKGYYATGSPNQIVIDSLSGDPTDRSGRDSNGCGPFDFSGISDKNSLVFSWSGVPGADVDAAFEELNPLEDPLEICQDPVVDTGGHTGDTAMVESESSEEEDAPLYSRAIPPKPEDWDFPVDSIPTTLMYAWWAFWEAPPELLSGEADPTELQAWKHEMHSDWDSVFATTFGFSPFQLAGGNTLLSAISEDTGQTLTAEMVRFEGHRYIEWLVVSPYARQIMDEVTADWYDEKIDPEVATWYLVSVLNSAPPPSKTQMQPPPTNSGSYSGQ